MAARNIKVDSLLLMVEGLTSNIELLDVWEMINEDVDLTETEINIIKDKINEKMEIFGILL